MNDMVLRPLKIKELRKFFDDKAIEILKFQLEKSIIAQPERKEKEKEKVLQITKEYLEQWCVQAIEGVKPKGAGNYPIDILSIENWGADIKALACPLDKDGKLNLGDSGEASLGQNFNTAGKFLDNLFIKKKYEEIKDKWIEVLNNKYDKVKKELDIQDFYFFFFLRAKTKFYLCGAYIETNNFNKLIVNNYRTTEDSVFLKNFIDDYLGNTKIYKAKKRLELRLTPKNWIDRGLCIELPIPNYLPAVNLREKNLDLYKKEIFNFKSNIEIEDAIYFNDEKLTSLSELKDSKYLTISPNHNSNNYVKIYKNNELIFSLKVDIKFEKENPYIVSIIDTEKSISINFLEASPIIIHSGNIFKSNSYLSNFHSVSMDNKVNMKVSINKSFL